MRLRMKEFGVDRPRFSPARSPPDLFNFFPCADHEAHHGDHDEHQELKTNEQEGSNPGCEGREPCKNIAITPIRSHTQNPPRPNCFEPAHPSRGTRRKRTSASRPPSTSVVVWEDSSSSAASKARPARSCRSASRSGIVHTLGGAGLDQSQARPSPFRHTHTHSVREAPSRARTRVGYIGTRP